MEEIRCVEGNCLCGKISLKAHTKHRTVEVCHCSMCRKWSGSPTFWVDCDSEVELSGTENLTTYNSSEWAERGFCKHCGTHLFYRIKENNQYVIPAGLLNGIDDFIFDKQIFIDEKPEYYGFANDTKVMTGAEVFAQYAPDG